MDCCNNDNSLFVSRWASFLDFVPSVPQLYWNVDSNEQRYHLLCKQLHKLVCYADMLGIKINLDHDRIDALENEFEEFRESGFLDYYEQQLDEWINANMPEIIGKYIRMVFFGINMDGYFVAYIPDGTGWDDIVFDTGANYEMPDYGRLILRYEVDAPYNVQQREPFEADFGDLWDIVANMTGEIQDIDGTLDTHADDISDIQATQTQQAGSISDIEGDISNIQATQTQQAGSISDIEGDISDIQATQTQQASDMANINANMTNINTAMGVIQATQTSQQGSITMLDNAVFTALRSDEND